MRERRGRQIKFVSPPVRQPVSQPVSQQTAGQGPDGRLRFFNTCPSDRPTAYAHGLSSLPYLVLAVAPALHDGACLDGGPALPVPRVLELTTTTTPPAAS